ncbi:hypothetical protein LEGA110927_03420 [Leuconostoc gasicomitatum]|uniref:hypothetical protein n=1 Tax=Leuconostoc gasicomitatum TaxID=115778 RepID=UPI000BC8FA0E|nr:hypothetical protein [Leuconostoc gasicomitatum]MBZ5967266.1 hypothetical protein [Leuconostoc gasicomitatum]QFS15363.1 hypothetical protein BHS03_06845 [Leuconostoc gasicomitatum]SOB97841.1 conserved hypothetical protein [Leuconostoc gasicomitatum]
MQQGHPRHKQLSRARHEMYLHNRHKAECIWTAIKNVMTGINNAISVVGKRIDSALGINKQMSAPKIEPDISPIIYPDVELNITPLVDYNGVAIKRLTTNCF